MRGGSPNKLKIKRSSEASIFHSEHISITTNIVSHTNQRGDIPTLEPHLSKGLNIFFLRGIYSTILHFRRRIDERKHIVKCGIYINKTEKKPSKERKGGEIHTASIWKKNLQYHWKHQMLLSNLVNLDHEGTRMRRFISRTKCQYALFNTNNDEICDVSLFAVCCCRRRRRHDTK